MSIPIKKIAAALLLLGIFTACTNAGGENSAEEIAVIDSSLVLSENIAEVPEETVAVKEALNMEEADIIEIPLETSQRRGYQYFWKSPVAWVGDPMPYYEDGVFHVFYLSDARDGNPTNPFGLVDTTDMIHYDYQGIVLKMGVNSQKDQDYIIATGSVIKAQDGKYHAFYTGHNPNVFNETGYREACMHAVSDDMLNWTKIPEDTFFPDVEAGYSKIDFRDQQVYWMEDEQEYWMLICTTLNGTGHVARYTSKDLTTWERQAPLYDMGFGNVTECPDLFKMGDKWYLVYSTEWKMRYVMADSPYGPWSQPEYFRFDGHGFYAGKTASDGQRRYMFGWITTKNPPTDYGTWGWGGNLQSVELLQNPDGTLRVEIPHQITDLFAPYKQRVTEALHTQGDAVMENGLLTLTGTKDISGVILGTVHDKMLIEANITVSAGSEYVGFMSNFKHEISKGYGLNWDKKNNVMKFIEGQLQFFRMSEQNEAAIPVAIPEGVKTPIKILIDNDCISLFYSDHKLSARMYNLTGAHWGFYSIIGQMTVENITYSIMP